MSKKKQQTVQPRQQRSRQRVEKILDTTANLLCTEGLDAINTNRIAKAAGMSVASLYRYFPNKQAILLALFQREVSRAREVMAPVSTPDEMVATWLLGRV